MSPLELRYQAWKSEGGNLLAHLHANPSFRASLTDFRAYHELTGFVNEKPEDFEPRRFWRPDGRLSLLAFAIERRSQRLNIKDKKKPPDGISPPFGGCPLAEKNVFWQNSGRQFPYPKSINGNPYNWLVQIQSFARDHYTIASANHEPQDWRPSLNVLHQRVADSCTIAALLDCLVLYNGDGAGDSIPQWFHLQALRPPDDGLLPVQQAIGLMPAQLPPQSPVMRISEPLWPLPAFRVVGTAEVIAGEVTKLARRCSEIAGERATESIAIYVRDGVLTCIYVPRDRTREYVEEFGGKLGAFEVAAGAFVFSDPDRCAALRGGQIAFTDLWAMLRRVRPEWADEL